MSALSRLDTPAPGAVGRTAYADLTATLIQTRQQLAPKRLFVRADPNLSHRADPILSQGWKPTF